MPELAREIITTLITINGVLIGFLGTTQSNILAIDSREVIRLLKNTRGSDKKTRYERMLNKLKLARNCNAAALILGTIILLCLLSNFLAPFWIWILGVFVILEAICICTFVQANSLVDMVLKSE